MLDKNSIIILKILNNLANGNAYKVITGDEILVHLNKTQFDLDVVRQIIEFLEKQQYVNIKFSEENTYCYSLLPKAKIFLEQEQNKPTPNKNKQQIMFYVYTMIASFIGTMLALLIFFYLTF